MVHSAHSGQADSLSSSQSKQKKSGKSFVKDIIFPNIRHDFGFLCCCFWGLNKEKIVNRFKKCFGSFRFFLWILPSQTKHFVNKAPVFVMVKKKFNWSLANQSQMAWWLLRKSPQLILKITAVLTSVTSWWVCIFYVLLLILAQSTANSKGKKGKKKTTTTNKPKIKKNQNIT